MKKLLTILIALASVATGFAQSNNFSDTAAGTRIGRTPNKRLAFWGATPIPQLTGSNELIGSLQSLGLIKSGTFNTPLNLHNGALTAGTLVLSGTSYGGSIQATTFVNPTLTGTVTIASPVYTGTGSGTLQGVDLVVTTGTASPPAAGTIRVSGTNLLIYTGSNWITK